MASSFFARFDDIATLPDYVAARAKAKFATRKTAGVLGDDVASGELLVHGTSTPMALLGKRLQLSAAKFLGA